MQKNKLAQHQSGTREALEEMKALKEQEKECATRAKQLQEESAMLRERRTEVRKTAAHLRKLTEVLVMKRGALQDWDNQELPAVTSDGAELTLPSPRVEDVNRCDEERKRAAALLEKVEDEDHALLRQGRRLDTQIQRVEREREQIKNALVEYQRIVDEYEDRRSKIERSLNSERQRAKRIASEVDALQDEWHHKKSQEPAHEVGYGGIVRK